MHMQLIVYQSWSFGAMDSDGFELVERLICGQFKKNSSKP